MTMSASLSLLVGGLSLLLGVLALTFHERALRFVRRRYEQIYREDALPDEEISRRLPRMRAVTVIAVGFVVVSAGFVAAGLFGVR
ncbi:hypothetical protein [Microbacterium hydrocarbonoxydans]|uniref:hypothetical protein n=1 Tax=Microbacterium hydrocarbonoxydans TaxID=273678 RepID=UPI003D95C381